MKEDLKALKDEIRRLQERIKAQDEVIDTYISSLRPPHTPEGYCKACTKLWCDRAREVLKEIREIMDSP